MPLKISSLVTAIATVVLGQALCSATALAQDTPKHSPAPARPTWRNFFKNTDISENGFRSRLQIRNQTRLDGWQVAIVTNISPSSLYYEGYGPTTPRGFVEELQEGRWVPTGWDGCGTGLSMREIKPGRSCRLFLPTYTTDKHKKTRCWVIFSNAPYPPHSKRPRGLNLKRSLMLLNNGGK